MRTRLSLRALTTNKKKLAAAAAAALVGTSGVAYALWTTTANGTSTAKASANTPSVVTAAADPAASLWPGGPAATINFTLNNPNPYPVVFNTAALTVNSVAGGAGCLTDHFTAHNPGSVNFAVPANATSVAASIPGAVAMVAGAPDACQGATVTLGVSLTGIQTS